MENCVKFCFVRLYFAKIYCIINNENENKRSELPPFDIFVVTYYFHDLGCETDIWEVVNMVETALLKITCLLFYGLVGMTIIDLALLIIICFLLHRQ